MNILFDERLDGELVHRDKAEVLSDLQSAVPTLTLLHREEDLRPFECDGLAAYRVLPMLVALPETLARWKACSSAVTPWAYRWLPAALAPGFPAAHCPSNKACCWSCRASIRSSASTPMPVWPGTARRSQPGDFRGGGALWPVLRARPVFPDCLLHWR